MRPDRTTRWLAALLLLLAVTLAVLATLQYRWIGEVSRAEEQRMRSSLDDSSRRFADDLNRELGRVMGSFPPPPPDRDATMALAHHYEQWISDDGDPRMIKAIYAIGMDDKLWRFDPAAQQLAETPWPPALAEVRELPRRFEGFVPAVPALVAARRGGMPPPGERRPPRGEDEGRPPGGRPFGGPPPWGPPREESPVRAFLLELDRQYLAAVLLPELKRRHFGDEYDIAVMDGDSMVFGSRIARPEFQSPLRLMANRPGAEPPPPRWRIVGRRHAGPLTERVVAARRRNLAVSGGVLVLLAVAVIILAFLVRRADRLRAQQFDFVAGITHELNTPLAALTSAGQNLADGIISTDLRVVRYGAMIAREARRLSDLVAQVLEFAGLQARGAPRVATPVDVAMAVQCAVADSHWVADENGVSIETTVAPELPPVEADAEMLATAIRNLVVNAVRHGGEGGWVAVRADRDAEGVAITVEDRGKGIAARDLPHLFEPFYRGRGADTVRGTGLGLSIVQQIAKSYGGRVTVERRRQRGAAFTLHFPAVQNA